MEEENKSGLWILVNIKIEGAWNWKPLQSLSRFIQWLTTRLYGLAMAVVSSTGVRD